MGLSSTLCREAGKRSLGLTNVLATGTAALKPPITRTWTYRGKSALRTAEGCMVVRRLLFMGEITHPSYEEVLAVNSPPGLRIDNVTGLATFLFSTSIELSNLVGYRPRPSLPSTSSCLLH